MEPGWTAILAEPRTGPFPLPAYSEFMPPPYVGRKPYGEPDPWTRTPGDERGWNVSEFEEALELAPGLRAIAERVVGELAKAARGEPSAFTQALVHGNPAWPPAMPGETFTILLPVALSRTQDDKGRVRWTLFGASHEGPSRPFWRSLRDLEALRGVIAWAASDGPFAVLPDDEPIPEFARGLVWDGSTPPRVLVTFRPFAELPAAVQRAYLDGSLRIVPCPASLAFWHHEGFRKLAAQLPLATQIPLLSLFPRREDRQPIRIPPSGRLDERADAPVLRRSHRWQRVGRDEPDPVLDDPVTVALFSADPDHLGLYGKPMARNAHVWTERYELLLDGPRAGRAEIERAAEAFHAGGRYGYRMFYPPMRAGERSVFWHRPILANAGGLCPDPPLGYLTAEREGAPPIVLWPRVGKPVHVAGGADARKLVEWRELLGRPLPPAFAARLLRGKTAELGPEEDPGEPLTFERTATREFEERYWRTIAALCDGPWKRKNNADGGRDLASLGDYLKRHYAGRAECVDHRFEWKTDFAYGRPQGTERNVIAVIPGRNRREAILMADHYDTAYMEDVYDRARGGDGRRAAAPGADDNHSATAALMLAADVLLPLSRDGRLARDVWLVHLTGEEFPADCLGARALARALIEGTFPLDARVRGAYVLDMIAHNNDRGRDVFQIAPGEGRGSAHLAWWAHVANERWNRGVRAWNAASGRRGRARRVTAGAEPPPVAEHLALTGEVRPEWDPRSALYNTDGQILSDVGIPVVLLMENYDIHRTGYHDTGDTMALIDLDYGAAMAAIAIEAVALAATADEA